ncbi:transcriptional regulator with XRE-family HTH domain [Thermocatellispora tengchongensis]|uniref:Transcriptional regulator with XRE-family HTH domain n=1 Tax=Thermocatellispora tengchongensis TaxID=1073253 RepID=A0A840NT25_9ACTN|nr:XRE family transcriptional regulator [Thermocatellispora tengchongensis]MBB5131854.1 transcriptional regulator with XRE-family HTH domain [Thermocatellispora tengchongensis]
MRAGDARAEGVRVENARVGDAQAEGVRAEDARAGDAQAEGVRVEDVRGSDVRAGRGRRAGGGRQGRGEGGRQGRGEGSGERARSGAPLDVIAASLRRERERAGLSLTELARRAEISKSTLSQLESGTGNPSVETLWALGVALNVPFGRLVQPPAPAVQVIRRGEGPAVASERADYIATLLASCPPHARRDIYLISAEPGTARESDPHMPGVVEHVVICSGRARLGIAEDPVELGPGDYIAYPGDVAHVFEALEPGTLAVLVSEHV